LREYRQAQFIAYYLQHRGLVSSIEVEV
jgi:hypothetical protein